MNQTLYAFLLTTIAGLSTLIGFVVIFFNRKKTNKIIISSLAFASSVMIMISFTDLIPESLNLIKKYYLPFPSIITLLISINMGIIISLLVAKYLPEKDNKLYRIGLISMVAIILHNIPEGIATFMASNTNKKLGLSLTIAIALHNIPEGISIAFPIYYATGNKYKAFLYTFISGISELFGSIITYLFLKPYITDKILGILFGIISGVMFHISIYELLKTSLKYNKKKITIYFFILGIMFVIISQIIF